MKKIENAKKNDRYIKNMILGIHRMRYRFDNNHNVYEPICY
jgi:hypothetical protein